MQDLIKIGTSNINGAEVNSVNARDIHEYLEVKTPFSMWIDRAIKRYVFKEDTDFTTHTFVNGKATQTDFIVTISMAKELAMLENNEKGRKTRRYFIAYEEKAKEIISNQSKDIQLLQGMLNTLSKMDSRVATTESKIDYLENKSPIIYNQIKTLEDLRKSKTKQLVGYDPQDEVSKQNYSRTIRSLTKVFKNRFDIARYADLPKDQYEEAIKWLNNICLVDLVGV